MRSRFVVVAYAALAALAGCGHKASRPSQCDDVVADPLHAVAKLSAKFANDPVKVATIIEDCVAPTGEVCDRVGLVMNAVPSLIGTDGLVLPDSMSLCDTMPPELQQCLLPSYVLAHKDACAKLQASWRAAPAVTPSDAAVACAETKVYLDDDQLAYGRETKIPLPPLKESILDFDGLATGLKRLASTCVGPVTVVASPTMMYQDILDAMDL